MKYPVEKCKTSESWSPLLTFFFLAEISGVEYDLKRHALEEASWCWKTLREFNVEAWRVCKMVGWGFYAKRETTRPLAPPSPQKGGVGEVLFIFATWRIFSTVGVEKEPPEKLFIKRLKTYCFPLSLVMFSAYILSPRILAILDFWYLGNSVQPLKGYMKEW